MTPYRIGALTIIALLLLALVWQLWWLPPARVPAGFAALLHALPMLPASLLLLQGKRAAILVGALGALFMFSHGVMEAWVSPAARMPALLETGLALSTIVAASWNGFQQRRAKRGAL